MINSLNVAQTGLKAAQTAVENVMNNIANENTAGYKKRTVSLTELAHNDSRIVGRGVFIESVDRATSNYMFNNLIDEGTKESYYQTLSGMFEGVESLFKETDTSGFSADLNRYFQSIENLRSNPESSVYNNDVKTQGTIIVDSLKRLYEGIEKQEEIAKESLEDDIETINGILNDIGKINEQLGQEIVASNDLLDRRDALEEELSQYIDISVDRSEDDYILKIGGVTAVRHSTNVREVNLEESYTYQKDRYINDDYVTDTTKEASSILNGLTFDNNDVITFKLDNTASVSVTFGETVDLDFDIDGDNINDTIVVDEDNYVRALVQKINTHTDMVGRVEAYNGEYALNEDGERETIDHVDNFLLIEAKEPGKTGKFNTSISFVEQEDTQVGLTPPGEFALNSITSDKKRENAVDPQQSMTHTISFTGSSVTAQEFDFDISGGTAVNGLNATVTPANFDTGTDYDGVTFTNGVTYDATTGKITVPAGVTEFDVSFPIVNDGAGANTDYTLTVGSMSATGNIQDETAGTEIVSITSSSVEEQTASGSSTTLIHAVSLSGATDGATDTVDITIDDITGSPVLDFSSDVTSIDLEYFDMNGTSLGTANIPITTTPISAAGLTPPAGTTNFTISMPVANDSSGEFSESYSLSVTDGTNTLETTGTITDDDVGTSKLILRNDYQSNEAENVFGVSVYDKLIPVSSGSLKAQLDNLNTESGLNVFDGYKDQLDQFAKTLSDMTDMYMRNDDGSYIYGEMAIDDLGVTPRDLVSLGLFTGSDVNTLQFNAQAVNDLDQNDLDYLATMQFKQDIYFNGKPQGSTNSDYEDVNATTFADYFQSVRVGVSSDKENNDFLKDTQESVVQSIQNTYDQITKVDRDEEMLELIKFQAAYTANAKIVTVVDEMLNTLLGLKS